VKLKKIATSVGIVLAATVGMAHADVNSQLASLQAQVNQLQSQVNSSNPSSGMGNLVGVNSNLSWRMMSNYSGVGKEMNLLKARQMGLSTLTVGGEVEADAIYAHVNQNGANTYNFANPAINGANPSGSTATRLAIPNVNLSTVASLGKWITGYVQVGKPNIGNQYVVKTTPTTFSQSNTSVAVQDAYLVFGNLSRMPVYGFAGYKDIDFGSFATVDMYNQPLTRTLFQAQGNTVGAGFNGYGFNGVVSLINGGQHNQVLGVNGAVQQENLSTTNNNNIGNFAVNASYGMTNGVVNWNVGAGYINGSQFTTYNNKTDGAWDLNAKVSAMGFDVLAEYVTTATKSNLGAAANQKRVQAWDLGADYNFPVMGYKTVINADYSQAYLAQGGNNNAGGRTGQSLQGSQYVLGYRVQPVNNVWTGIEYAYSHNLLGAAAVPAAGSVIAPAVQGNKLNNNTVTLDVTAMF
jgi:hypothetical protein